MIYSWSMLEKYNQHILPLAFLLTAGALVASMVLSSVYNLVPCELCWYQRMLMLPIPLILGVALLKRDYSAYWYVLPFSILGMVVAFYQLLLQWGVVGESNLICDGTIPCGEAQIELLGFMTIPLGAFLTFAGITALMVAQAKYGKAIKTDFNHQLELLLKLVAVVLVSLLAFLLIKQFVS